MASETTAPYTAFGQTLELPVRVHQGNGYVADPENGWDAELWVERGEDWYALQAPSFKGKRVRIIERAAWLYARGHQ